MNIGQNTSENDDTTPLVPYQSLVFWVYAVGVAVMVLFNINCYPGSFVGIFGWAVIWPVYVPANLVRIWFALQSGDGATLSALWGEVCQEAVMGFRAG